MPGVAIKNTVTVFDQTGGWSTSSSPQYPSTTGIAIDPTWSRYGAWIYWTKGSETGVALHFETKRPGAAGWSPVQSTTPESPTLNLDSPHRITLTGGTTFASCYVPLCFGFWSGLQFAAEMRVGVTITGTPNGTTRVAFYLQVGSND